MYWCKAPGYLGGSLLRSRPDGAGGLGAALRCAVRSAVEPLDGPGVRCATWRAE